MTSGPGAVARLRPRGWTLRARLVAALVALLAAVSLVIGLVGVLALQTFLTGRLDDQLTSAGGRSRSFADRPSAGLPGDGPGGGGRGGGRPGPGGAPGPGFLLAPGQGEGTLGAVATAAGVVDAGVLDEAGDPRDLAPAQRAALLRVPADGSPHTVDLGAALGSYRVLAQPRPGGEVLLTGLPLSGVQGTVMRLAGVVTAVTLAGLAAAALAGAVIVRLTLRPLTRIAGTAARVAELPLDRGEVALAERVAEPDTDPRTEVGRVGAALNRMLGHVAAALAARQHSEQRVRRFVADASHELRTPLAAIRGYAELTRRGGQPVPPDVAHALRRVESEAVRMTAMVDDLLLLARLDEGRPLEREPVDLTMLLVDAVADARAAGPEHRWELDLPDEPVTVTGDAARLHQMVANLLGNARTHTPPGSTVTAVLTAPGRADPDRVRLAVLDDGPGIPAELLPDVFDRFTRGDASRSRSAGSTGLGLSIVAAVVAAHDGAVTADSHPGRTAFAVTLPRHPATPTPSS